MISSTLENLPGPSTCLEMETHMNEDNKSSGADNREEVVENILDNMFFSFLNSLHADSSLTKKAIQIIIETVKNEIIATILRFKNDENIDEKIENSYKKYNSFYKFKKQLEKRNMFYTAHQNIINERIDLLYKKGEPVYDVVKESVSIMPIRQQIKAFFELPGMLD